MAAMGFKLPSWLVGSGRVRAVEAAKSSLTWHGNLQGDAVERLKAEWVQVLRLNPLVKKAFFVRASLADGEAARPMLVLVAKVQPEASWLAGLTQLADGALPEAAPPAVTTLGPKDCAPLERVSRPFYYSV
jgi:hypothetical protein